MILKAMIKRNSDRLASECPNAALRSRFALVRCTYSRLYRNDVGQLSLQAIAEVFFTPDPCSLLSLIEVGFV